MYLFLLSWKSQIKFLLLGQITTWFGTKSMTSMKLQHPLKHLARNEQATHWSAREKCKHTTK